MAEKSDCDDIGSTSVLLSSEQEKIIVSQSPSQAAAFVRRSPRALARVKVKFDHRMFLDSVDKRKRSASPGSTSSSSSTMGETSEPPVKKNKSNKQCDKYCWICHKGESSVECRSCPRVFHIFCLDKRQELFQDGTCPECQNIAISISRIGIKDCHSSDVLTPEHLCSLLSHALEIMTSHAPVLANWPFSPEKTNTTLRKIMDLDTLQKNVKKNKYTCTALFLADVRWIPHNCTIAYGGNHSMTSFAKSIVKICKREIRDIEACSDCYIHLHAGDSDWFCVPCTKPHTLVWAKLKGFPFWPAKVIRVTDVTADVRFFGSHEKSLVPLSHCYLLSKESPGDKIPKTGSFKHSMDELKLYLEQIEKKFGKYQYAPLRTLFEPSPAAHSRKTSVKKANAANPNYLKRKSSCTEVLQTTSQLTISTVPHVEATGTEPSDRKEFHSSEVQIQNSDVHPSASNTESEAGDINCETLPFQITSVTSLSVDSFGTEENNSVGFTRNEISQEISDYKGETDDHSYTMNTSQCSLENTPLKDEGKTPVNSKNDISEGAQSTETVSHCILSSQQDQTLSSKDAAEEKALSGNVQLTADDVRTSSIINTSEAGNIKALNNKLKVNSVDNLIHCSGSSTTSKADITRIISTSSDHFHQYEKSSDSNELTCISKSCDTDISFDVRVVVNDCLKQVLNNDSGMDKTGQKITSKHDLLNPPVELSTPESSSKYQNDRDVPKLPTPHTMRTAQNSVAAEAKDSLKNVIKACVTSLVEDVTNFDKDVSTVLLPKHSAQSQINIKKDLRVSLRKIDTFGHSIESGNKCYSENIKSQSLSRVKDLNGNSMKECENDDQLLNCTQSNKGINSNETKNKVAQNECPEKVRSAQPSVSVSSKGVKETTVKDRECSENSEDSSESTKHEMDKALDDLKQDDIGSETSSDAGKETTSEVRKSRRHSKSFGMYWIDTYLEPKKKSAKKTSRMEFAQFSHVSPLLESYVSEPQSVSADVTAKIKEVNNETKDLHQKKLKKKESFSKKDFIFPSTESQSSQMPHVVKNDTSSNSCRLTIKGCNFNKEDKKMSFTEIPTDNQKGSNNSHSQQICKQKKNLKKCNTENIKPSNESIKPVVQEPVKPVQEVVKSVIQEPLRPIMPISMNTKSMFPKHAEDDIVVIEVQPEIFTQPSSSPLTSLSELPILSSNFVIPEISNKSSAQKETNESGLKDKSKNDTNTKPSQKPQLNLSNAESQNSVPTATNLNSCPELDVLKNTVPLQEDVPIPDGPNVEKYAEKALTFMRTAMEEMWKEVVNTPNIKKMICCLRKQIEELKVKHQQELAEIKNNADLILMDMKASVEEEKQKAVEEVRRQCELEKQQAVEETKKKQWCSNCGNEAIFYCCWNTSYCDYPCQQAHWPEHMNVCSQTQQFSEQPDVVLDTGPPNHVEDLTLVKKNSRSPMGLPQPPTKSAEKDDVQVGMHPQHPTLQAQLQQPHYGSQQPRLMSPHFPHMQSISPSPMQVMTAPILGAGGQSVVQYVPPVSSPQGPSFMSMGPPPFPLSRTPSPHGTPMPQGGRMVSTMLPTSATHQSRPFFTQSSAPRYFMSSHQGVPLRYPRPFM